MILISSSFFLPLLLSSDAETDRGQLSHSTRIMDLRREKQKKNNQRSEEDLLCPFLLYKITEIFLFLSPLFFFSSLLVSFVLFFVPLTKSVGVLCFGLTSVNSRKDLVHSSEIRWRAAEIRAGSPAQARMSRRRISRCHCRSADASHESREGQIFDGGPTKRSGREVEEERGKGSIGRGCRGREKTRKRKKKERKKERARGEKPKRMRYE